MTTLTTRLTELLPLDCAMPGDPAKSGRWFVRVALCMLTLLAAAPAAAQTPGSLLSWGSGFVDAEHGLPSHVVDDTPTGTFIAVSAGLSLSHAIRTDGTLVSWGADSIGEVHDFGNGPEYVLTGQIADTPAGTFTAVSAGFFHSVAIRTDGTLVSWGSDFDHYSIGFDDITGAVSETPAGTFIAVAAGLNHTVAIRTDGTLVEWGDEVQSELALRPTTGTYIAVGAGVGYSVALRSDGTLVTWGNHELDVVLDTPAGTFISLAGGYHHAVAIRTDGTLASWGHDGHGAVSDTPAGTYIAVSAGDPSVAVRPNGTLVAWGEFADTVLDTPAGAFMAVAVGGSHAVAIRRPPTFFEQIADLNLSLLELVDDGAPLPSNGQPLLVKLDAAADALAVDDTDSAIGSLGAFVNQTEAYVRTKKLTAAQGESLVGAAELIITGLGG